MNGVSMNVAIDDGATASLRAIAARIKNLDPALDEIGASQVTETQQRFEDQVGPDGKKWVSLSAVTLEKRKAPRPQILREKGELYDSITHAVLSLRGVKVGTNRRYARIHQLGGKAGRGRKVSIPARPYLGLSPAGEKEILEILSDHVGRAAP